jgi:signal transduction histidine kinase
MGERTLRFDEGHGTRTRSRASPPQASLWFVPMGEKMALLPSEVIPRTGDDGRGATRYRASVGLVDRYRVADEHHPYRNDAAVGTLLLFAAVVNRLVTPGTSDRPVLEIGSFVGCALLIAVRRRFPLTVVVAAVVLKFAAVLLGLEATFEAIALWSALYTAGTLGSEVPVRLPVIALSVKRRDAVRGVIVFAMAIGAAVSIFNASIVGRSATTNGAVDGLATVLSAVTFLGSAWFIGDLVRTRRQTDLQLAAEREQNTKRALLDERVRIARELHDVVAHHVSLMGLQAGAARLALRTRPERAEAALSEVERSSRQAVAEFQRLLVFLRQDELDGRAPQPTLADLPRLAADVTRAGRAVRLNVDGAIPSELSSTLQLTAYRIVQEALTNALKHSDQAAIEVTVTAQEQSLCVRVHDYGRPLRPGPAVEQGHGLVGIRERVAFHGGDLSIEPTANSFVVSAALPFRGAAA